MKTDLITPRQLDAYRLFQRWIAEQMSAQGITINDLLEVIEVRPTETNLHEVFKAILGAKYQKVSTKDTTREEWNECLEDYMKALAESNIVIDFPDESMRSLLQNNS